MCVVIPTRHHLTVGQAADRIGCTYRHARRLVATGELRGLVVEHPTHPKRNRVYVTRQAITAFTRSRSR